MDTRVSAHKAAQEALLNNFTIRAAEPTDAAEISALMGSKGIFEGTLQMPFAAVASRVEMLSKTESGNVRLVAVQRTAGAGLSQDCVVAHAGLFSSHPSLRRMHVRGLGIAVAKEFQGQGLGERLMLDLLDWADNWAGVLRVELTVFTDNTRAIALYERHGFVQEGVMRASALRDGMYEDVLAMARLHPKQPTLLIA